IHALPTCQLGAAQAACLKLKSYLVETCSNGCRHLTLLRGSEPNRALLACRLCTALSMQPLVNGMQFDHLSNRPKVQAGECIFSSDLLVTVHWYRGVTLRTTRQQTAKTTCIRSKRQMNPPHCGCLSGRQKIPR